MFNNNNLKKITLHFTQLITMALFLCLNSNAQAQEANPRFSFFSQGQTPGAWQWVLSDPSNWWLPLTENTGRSKSGKIAISPSDDQTFLGAVKLSWNENPEFGGASITGFTTNLAPYEHNAELSLAVKLEKRADYVSLKMNCGENCEASINISDHLKKAKLNTWFALPIPLDCFTAQGVDLSNIQQPFSIGTQGSMILHIAEIKVAAMKGDDQGCTPNPSPIKE